MKHKRLMAMMDEDYDDRMDIFKAKSHDYADEDCLSNFKRMGNALNSLSVNELTPSEKAAITASELALVLFTCTLRFITNLSCNTIEPSSLNDVDMISGILLFLVYR